MLLANPSLGATKENLTWLSPIVEKKSKVELKERTLKVIAKFQETCADIEKMELHNAKVLASIFNSGNADLEVAETYITSPATAAKSIVDAEESMAEAVDPRANTIESTADINETVSSAKKKRKTNQKSKRLKKKNKNANKVTDSSQQSSIPPNSSGTASLLAQGSPALDHPQEVDILGHRPRKIREALATDISNPLPDDKQGEIVAVFHNFSSAPHTEAISVQASDIVPSERSNSIKSILQRTTSRDSTKSGGQTSLEAASFAKPPEDNLEKQLTSPLAEALQSKLSLLRSRKFPSDSELFRTSTHLLLKPLEAKTKEAKTLQNEEDQSDLEVRDAALLLQNIRVSRLPTANLIEYQAYERAGFDVWRHDRSVFACVLPGCGRLTLDHESNTVICHGCGTKSWIRYCSRQHLLSDMSDHWKECGDATTVFHQSIDEDTQPARFKRRYPAIVDANGSNSFQRHRQRTYAIENKGQYTMFLTADLAYIVEWPEHLAETCQPRVERLLNAAFFDGNNVAILDYLFRLLRFCLRQTGKWTDNICTLLVLQFRLEFGWNARGAYDEDPCECEWLGDAAKWQSCSRVCKETFENVGVLFKGCCIQDFVKKMEAEQWILRAWHRQHPTVKSWRRRMMGEGFEGVPEWQRSGEWRPVLGEGWEGWGSTRIDGERVSDGGMLYAKVSVQ